ncbi:hypothetical protein RDV84_11015 [Lysobacter yananisis]|uniref:DUF4189 domain-containing protein n=1 Tax=Lysobacter yananisis TaxID=1003114 RepID=A0ABY9PE56_9GAMM|nr:MULTISPECIES: hypothetical protein [Lysobacter]UZW61471.1 hypothetical protein BV903_003985 [Lysobacter enzymogenes]WMT05345.1 hypothetical protein RDV84_11015 [Lysobacter yananisis]
MNMRKSGRVAAIAALWGLALAGAALPAAAADWVHSGRYQYFSEGPLGGNGSNGCQSGATPLASGDCIADPGTGWAANFNAAMAAADAVEATGVCVLGYQYPSSCRFAGYALNGQGVSASENFYAPNDLPRPCVAGTHAVAYVIFRRVVDAQDGSADDRGIESDYSADEYQCR